VGFMASNGFAVDAVGLCGSHAVSSDMDAEMGYPNMRNEGRPVKRVIACFGEHKW